MGIHADIALLTSAVSQTVVASPIMPNQYSWVCFVFRYHSANAT
jgi:hypothetical protein